MSDIVQRSADWLEIRRGRVTASRIGDIMAKTKSGAAASRANYLAELICERLTGQTADRFVAPAMVWGTDAEPLARMAYELHAGVLVDEIGFVAHPRWPDDAGASPDGLVGPDGLLEIKCPNTATHLDTLLGASIAGKYLYQMQFQLACTGRAWCDFASFDPRLPAHLQLHVTRVPRSPDLIAEIEREVGVFLAELGERVAFLSKLAGSAGADNAPRAAA